MIHSCTSKSIKDDDKTVAEGDDDGVAEAWENDENEGARTSRAWARPLKKLNRDKVRYATFAEDIGIAAAAKVIPNRWQITHPSDANLRDTTFCVVSKYTRFEQTIFTIGLFAKHAFWATHSRRKERRVRARNMLAALIMQLLPYTKYIYANLFATTKLEGPCQDALLPDGCSHIRQAKIDHKRQSNERNGTPQEALTDTLVLFARAVKDKCKTAAYMLKRMLFVIAQQADKESARFVKEP